MPVLLGRLPVKVATRDGLQTGAAQWALVNNKPRFASRSMFGVLASGWPSRQPTQSFMSSAMIIRTLGRETHSLLVGEINDNNKMTANGVEEYLMTDVLG